MTKQLELRFENVEGRIVTLALEDPIEPVDPAAVSTVMDGIIAANVFYSTGGDLISKKEARIVERTITEIPLQ